jgi:hypothetical protein
MWPTLLKKVNRFTIKDYFDKLKELLMRLDIMDKPERIYSVVTSLLIKIRIFFLLFSG